MAEISSATLNLRQFPLQIKTKTCFSCYKKRIIVIIMKTKNIKKIHETVNLLQKGEPLPERFCDHELTSNYAGHRECHVLPDLLLIYRIFKDIFIHIEFCVILEYKKREIKIMCC